MNKLKIINVSGSNYEIGFRIGSQTKKEISRLVQITPRVNSKDKKLKSAYDKYLSLINTYPDIMAEFRGIAEGANVNLHQIIKLNLPELNIFLNDSNPKILREAHELHCSTLIIKNNNHTIIGHNEDGGYDDDIFILIAKYPSGINVVSICYFGSIPGFAANLNSRGLIFVSNGLTSKSKNIAMPKRVLSRMIIECKTIKEAIDLIIKTKRGAGQNFILAQGENIFDVETSSEKGYIKEIKNNFYHCNNFLFDEMLCYEGREKTSGTYVRSHELKKTYKKIKDLEHMKVILSSHKNRPKCLCAHGEKTNDENKTLGSIFFDLKNKKVFLGKGFTCQTHLNELNIKFNW